MRFKKTLAVTIAAATIFSLAACGNSGDGEKEESDSKNSEDSSDVTLTVAIWDKNQEPGLKEIMADFTKETGIKTDIQITLWKDYWTMMEAATT